MTDDMSCERCGDSLSDNWGEGNLCYECMKDMKKKHYDKDH